MIQNNPHLIARNASVKKSTFIVERREGGQMRQDEINNRFLQMVTHAPIGVYAQAIPKGIQDPIGFTQVLMTPELAALCLTLNKGNRNLRKWFVNALRAAISRDEWICTHQGVAFSRSGRLVDGQHRLSAIAKSTKSVEMCVHWNVRDDAFTVMDAGIKRTLSDRTGLSTRAAQVMRLAASFLYPSDKDAAQLVSKIAAYGLNELHEDLHDIAPSNVTFFASAPMRLAAILMVMDGHDRNYVFPLYKNLVYANLDDLPKVGIIVREQVMRGNISAHHTDDVFARALKVFSYKYADVKSLKISHNERQDAKAWAVKVLSRLAKEANDD